MKRIKDMVFILIVIIFLSPLLSVAVGSLKTNNQILSAPFSMPAGLYLDNYKTVFESSSIIAGIVNSVLICLVANILICLLSAMASWKLARFKDKLGGRIALLLMITYVVPFQAIMLPLIRNFQKLQLFNTRTGLIVIYIGLGLSLSVSLYYNYFKHNNVEIEEAGMLDGCMESGVFFKIVMPQARHITATLMCLNTVWLWNDYLLPSLMLSSEDLYTVPLVVNKFMGQYLVQMNLAMAAVIIALVPILLFYFMMQRYIIDGISAGGGR